MLDYETRYVMIERYYLALVWATQRLRHYMTEYSVHLISRLDPLRYLLDTTTLVGRLMRWLVLLTEFDIHYVTRESIRWSIVADHLASLPVSDSRAIDDDFLDEDVAVVTSLSGLVHHSRINILPRNNIVEYEACILGLETTLELRIRQMEVFGDSNMVLRQIQGEWKTRDVKLRPYHAYLELLVERFDDLKYTHMPRAQNQFADVLASLASMIDIPTGTIVCPLLIEPRSIPTYCCLIDEAEFDDDLPWYHDIYQFLRLGAYPEVVTAKDKRALRQLAARFVICGETLYRQSVDGMLLLCLGPRLHQSSDEKGSCRSLWTTYGRTYVSPVSTSLGKISPKSFSAHEFILVVIDYFTDYFTKWVEATSYARLTSSGVASFIRSHIICRYGVPHELISNRGVHFKTDVDTLLQRYGIQHHRSSTYRPQTNRAIEVANKNIKRILWRMVETSWDWSKKLPFALWAYWTSFRTSIGVTPYFLVYGMEAVLPVIRGLIRDLRGKFRPNWNEPYFIRELTPKSAAWLMDLDGNRFSEPTNVDRLKRRAFWTLRSDSITNVDDRDCTFADRTTHSMMDDLRSSDFLTYYTSGAILGHISSLVEIYRSSWICMITPRPHSQFQHSDLAFFFNQHSKSSYHCFSVSAFKVIIASQFRRLESSLLLSFGVQSHHRFSVSGFRAIIASPVSAFRVIIASEFRHLESSSLLSFSVQSHHRFSVSAFKAIIASQFQRSEPSSLLNSGIQSHHCFSVSAFRVIITSQFRCSEPSSLLNSDIQSHHHFSI
ncbi:hypothetical protein CK203_084584 [Vitis vinifera]|uniref:Integrase catalytic domain-containing protein n=1 Tax=Vitis vinifera TaxID=29760 RepID=A0A438DNS6_VITVI|nr:hypothetical protein CK203_084584 [Vitis vinifera]